jgi:transposase-like protein
VSYSEKFKAEMVSKLMGPSRKSASQLSQECGVHQSTLSNWHRQAKVLTVTRTPKPKPTGRKSWSPEEKMRVVLAAASAGESGRGALLRREGLHEVELERFQAELEELVKGSRSQPAKRNAGDKKRIQELERELRRKDRALAEATALVVLSKKLQAYFGEAEVGETSEDSEK